MAITEDASTPAITTASDAGTTTTSTKTITSASFTPPAGTLLVALVNGGWGNGSAEAASITDSVGGTWTAGPAAVGTTTGARGVAAIFYRYLSSAPGSMTATATVTNMCGGRQIAVRVLNGAASDQTGAGTGTKATTTSTTTATVNITTTVTGSQVYAAFDNCGNASAMSVNGSTTILSGGDFNDTADTVRLVSCQATSATGTPGAITLGGTWATAANFNAAALEILPSATYAGSANLTATATLAANATAGPQSTLTAIAALSGTASVKVSASANLTAAAGLSVFAGGLRKANPNWPTVGFEIDFTNGPPNFPLAPRMSINAKYRRLVLREFSTTRGRSYELDQVQAGVLTASIVDPNELLNPDNPGSPFNTAPNRITSYRACWVRAMWPNQPGSGNIINTRVNSSYDPSFELNPSSALGLWNIVGGTTTFTQSTAQAYDGTYSLLVTQSATGAGYGVYNQFRTTPDLTHTFSAYVYPTSGAVTIQVAAADNTVSTSTTADTLNTWTRLTVTWNTVDTMEKITIYGTGAPTPTFYVDATQLEFGPTAATFTTTGPTLYPLFTGYVERYPTGYGMGGYLPLRPLYAVDALAVLSRTVINQSYAAEVAVDKPTFRISYSETAPPSNVVSPSGSVIQGIQSTVQGGNISWAGDQFPTGCPAVVLSQQVQPNATVGWLLQFAEVDIPHNNTYQIDTAGVTFECWARATNGSMDFGIFGANVTQEWSRPYNSTTNSFWGVIFTSTGLALWYQDATPGAAYPTITYAAATSGTFNADGTNLPDSRWHYYALTLYKRSGTNLYDISATVDAFEIYTAPGNPITKKGGNQVTSHATTIYTEPQSTVSVANVAMYPADIGSPRRLAHYRRGSGYLGELPYGRVTRLLNQYWGGVWTVFNGNVPLAPDHGYNGRVVLDVLQEIQETERGLVYVNSYGTVIFEDRNTRNNNPKPLWVFGENPTTGVGSLYPSPTLYPGPTVFPSSPGAGVEYPYTDYQTDYDPTFTFSDANLTRPGNSGIPPTFNQNTRNAYGQRVLTQTLQCNTDFEVGQAGIYYLNRYANPRTRVSKLTLDPAANPALWPVVLSLELSQRVTVTRRNGALTVTHDYYIEKIDHRVTDKGTWTVDLQMSPVFVSSPWVLGTGVLGSTTYVVY